MIRLRTLKSYPGLGVISHLYWRKNIYTSRPSHSKSGQFQLPELSRARATLKTSYPGAWAQVQAYGSGDGTQPGSANLKHHNSTSAIKGQKPTRRSTQTAHHAPAAWVQRRWPSLPIPQRLPKAAPPFQSSTDAIILTVIHKITSGGRPLYPVERYAGHCPAAAA